ncbi:MAG TPA: enoyl-CoA hydratase-related protein [Thermoanaerobaculia bacterium]|nr:enoyl-CoA hydratase-related protein [Thermoanaerobaculia bacterium]
MASVLEQLDDGVLTLTLNRPDRLNAYNAELHESLLGAFRRADRDDDVRAVVVTGAGRGFCAGADLEARGQTFHSDQEPEAYRDGGGLLSLEIFRLTKPVIAAINGPAVGVGVTMTLPMDVRIAAETAKLGFVFTRRGMVPEACSSFFLPRIVGISQALEWMLTGRVFSAREALEGGLVSRIVADAEVVPAAVALAREIAENTAPVSVALTRQMLWRQLSGSSPMRAHRIESRGIYSRGRSRDVQEGVASFLEKRRPEFPERVSEDMPSYYPWWKDEEF